MKTLFVDACPRAESRTRVLAEVLLACLGGERETVRLSETAIPRIDEAAIQQRAAGEFTDSLCGLARQFAAADRIVIAAPYWDLSFPALLKAYIEAVSVTGITFRYTPEGIPEGLCRAKALYYVTTSGGTILNEEFGYGYIRAMAQMMFGIADCRCFSAQMLDIDGSDVSAILDRAEEEIRGTFAKE